MKLPNDYVLSNEKKLRAILKNLGLQPAEIDNAIQNAFLKLLLQVDVQDFERWLFRVAINEGYDILRYKKRRKNTEYPESIPDVKPGPLKLVIQQDMDILYRKAVARLPEDFRAAWILRTDEKMPYAEIAEVLGVSVKTIYRYLIKARKLIWDQTTSLRL